MALNIGNIRAKIFNIFDNYKYTDDIMNELQKLKDNKIITSYEYDYIKENYNTLLAEWEYNI